MESNIVQGRKLNVQFIVICVKKKKKGRDKKINNGLYVHEIPLKESFH